MDLRSSIVEFTDVLRRGEVDVYNEFSLQHELGLYLRARHPALKVEFERNISHFGLTKAGFEKREIDLAVTSRANAQKVGAIELKYPRNGQVPETIFSFCKDICFLEQLADAGFQSTYFLALAEDPLFYSGREDGIYGLFRSGRTINGPIQKPTGSKDHQVAIRGSYQARWLPVADRRMFCLVEISPAVALPATPTADLGPDSARGPPRAL